MTTTDAGDQPTMRRGRLPDGIPQVYADQVIDVIYGFHTTKLIFGIEQGIEPGAMTAYENTKAVAVVIMPTPMLLGAAMRLMEQITAPALVQQSAERFHTVIETMEAIGQLVRSANEQIAASKGSAAPAGGLDGGQD